MCFFFYRIFFSFAFNTVSDTAMFERPCAPHTHPAFLFPALTKKLPFYQSVFKTGVDNIQESNVFVPFILRSQADHELSRTKHKSSLTADNKKMKIAF